jgi:stage IV sporulation protein A
MVITPWSEDAMPFTEAAELGTGKVIGEHATIAMLVTTDGSIAGLPRESYIHAEERVARELRQYGKPFAIILNSANPESESAHKLAGELEEKYGAPVALVCCPDLDADDIREILALVLSEFPVREMSFSLPEWTEALPSDHPLKKNIVESVQSFSEGVVKLGDIEKNLSEYDFERVTVNAGDGTAVFNIPIDRSEYYKTLSELCSVDVNSDGDIISTLMELSEIRDKYLRIEDALTDANEKGYGIVMPTVGELKLDEPTLVKQPNGYGVKVSAHADSIHMIKTGIKADLCPVIGSQEQSEEVVKFLQGEFEDNPDKVWEYNMFGRSLYDMVNDGMTAKLSHMPEESREKLGQTLGKIINEGSNGLICILL